MTGSESPTKKIILFRLESTRVDQAVEFIQETSGNTIRADKGHGVGFLKIPWPTVFSSCLPSGRNQEPVCHEDTSAFSVLGSAAGPLNQAGNRSPIMKKEFNNSNAAMNAAAGVAAITAETYAGMSDEERVSFNKSISVNEELALREVRKLIGSTKGKATMTVKGLRRVGVLVAARDVHDCRMEVYSNGFAAYRNGSHETVLRMEYVGKERYEGTPEVGIRNETYSLEEYGWGNAVMFCGEERIEEEYADKYKKRMVSTAGNAHCDEDGEEGDEMELDAGVDIAADYEREEEKERNLSRLTDKQRKVVEMYVFEHKTQQQIADALHISQSTVKNHIEAALKKLEA